MEALGILEQRVAQLIGLVQELRYKNEVIEAAYKGATEENGQLKQQLEQLQSMLLDRPQELALTRLMVDDLIKNIDAIMVKESSVCEQSS